MFNKFSFIMELLMPTISAGMILIQANSFGNIKTENGDKTLSYMIMPLFVLLFIPYIIFFSSGFVIYTMVQDKAIKMKETLRLMSLSRFSYAFSIFLLQTLLAIEAGLLVGGLLFNNPNLFQQPDDPDLNTQHSIQFILASILLHLGQTCFSMAFSTLFTETKTASAIGGLIIYMPIIFFIQVAKQDDGQERFGLYALFFFPLGAACPIFSNLTSVQSTPDLQIPQLLKSNEFININVAWAALILNIPFWLIMYNYLDQVMPSEFGVRKSWFFCLKRQKLQQELKNDIQDSNQNMINFSENDPIKIKNLSKIFNDYTAVNNITFSIKKNEIFTVLGHNGAGKTTMINILTGIIMPSSGNAILYDKSIKNNMDDIQRDLGLCQQFDVLYEVLTSQQHLKLACELKGVPKDQIPGLIEETLNIIMMTEHKDKIVKKLSGGMKRKLSLGIAIVTKPQVLILDEPTSGLDIESRRQIWGLIRKLKEGRSIIMSSQHLEEADELADRVLIMTRGQILALDTPDNIKKQYGVGYKVMIEPRDNLQSQDFKELKSNVLDPIILSKDNQDKGLKEDGESTSIRLIYQIPFTEIKYMTELLKELEKKCIHICYIDVQINSLEDAYINIAKDELYLLEQLKKKHNKIENQQNQLNLDLELQSVNKQDQQLKQIHCYTKIQEQQQNDEKRKNNMIDQIDPDDFRRYSSIQTNTTFYRQFSVTFKKRLFVFTHSLKEIIISISPWFQVTIQIIIITVIIEVIKDYFNIEDDGELQKNTIGSYFPFFAGIAQSLSFNLFVTTTIKDRENGTRYLLNISGMRPIAYYLGLFFSDFLAYLISPILFMITAFALQITSMMNAWIIFFLSFVFSAFPMVSSGYLIAFLFDKEETGFKYAQVITIIPFIFSYILTTILQIILENELFTQVMDILIPLQCFSSCIKAQVSIDQSKWDTDYQGNLNYVLSEVQWRWGVMFAQGLVFFLLSVFIDTRNQVKYKGKDNKTQTIFRNQLDENDDVIQHREFSIENWNNQQMLIQANQLSKVYGDGVAAVNKNTFCVRKGEVFGLLGPNGAGKSTMFNMMTMDLKRSDGEIKILGRNIDQFNVMENCNKMGMCPQYNTIWESLTVDQCLDYIANIKGLPYDEINWHKNFIKNILDIDQYSDIQSGKLSGGNKRKLVCAISLLACPHIEFLDEPTTGVDPVSRRSLFKVLKNLTKSSLILTTHRMEEAEALCDNIAIMINGRFVVVGTPGQIKDKYSSGYNITIKSIYEDKIDEYIIQNLNYLNKIDTIQLEEQWQGKNIIQFEYQVKNDISIESIGGLSEIFRSMNIMKFDHEILRDYTVTRSSLEQVFIQFAKHQIQQPDIADIQNNNQNIVDQNMNS